VDIITAEWAAETLSALIGDGSRPGRIRHICAGGERALRVGEVMDLVFATYENSVGRPVRRPRLVPLSTFEALRESMPARANEAMRGLMTFVPHLAIRQPFDAGETAGLLLPDVRVVIARLVLQEIGERTSGFHANAGVRANSKPGVV
jgi:hypothetical protein